MLAYLISGNKYLVVVVSVCPSFFSPSNSAFFTLYHLPCLPTQSHLVRKMAKLNGQLVGEISEAKLSVSGKAQGHGILGPFDGVARDSGGTGRCRRAGGVAPWKKNIAGTISCPQVSSLSCSTFSRLPWCAMVCTPPNPPPVKTDGSSAAAH